MNDAQPQPQPNADAVEAVCQELGADMVRQLVLAQDALRCALNAQLTRDRRNEHYRRYVDLMREHAKSHERWLWEMIQAKQRADAAR